MQDKPEKRQRPSPNRKSPPRENLPINRGVTTEGAGVNPEISTNQRTIELATDQSIAARNLLYNPNESTLAVIARCADGIGSVMDRMKRTGNKEEDLAKDEILISMCTRLMADGGTGRIVGFNDRLAYLVQKPKPDNYAESVALLAEDCRANMANITSTAKKPGPEGAVARQGILSFMGDLGGIEHAETGFGAAYKGPLCSPEIIYKTYAAGLCDAQRKLVGQRVPATAEEVDAFEKAFDASRKATSMKGGGLSAPAHTAGKKEQRAPVGWAVQERHGLLNTGDLAEERLKNDNPQHAKTLVDASWPSYLVSRAVTQDVVEPVTGHVSGTFGEMATTMNMFCGTPPESVTWETPSGTPIASANKDQVISIASLAAAGLITAGFHSAVEVFQPMSTFTTHATHGSIGPKAVEMMNKHSRALQAYANALDSFEDGRPDKWEHDQYALEEDELLLDKESLLSKAESIENAATKSVDMISMLQGDGGTIATLEVARVLANQSADPMVPFRLYSLNTRLDELGLRGHTPELEKARTLATLPVSDEQQANLAIALKAAEKAADYRDVLHSKATEAELMAVNAELKVEEAVAIAAEKQEVLNQATKATDELARKGWRVGAPPEDVREAIKQMVPLEEERKIAFRAANAAKLEATAAKAEAVAARQEAIAAKAEVTSIDESTITAAKAEAQAARKEATAARKEVRAAKAEAIADEAEAKSRNAEQIAADKQQKLQEVTRMVDEAIKIGWGGFASLDDGRKARDTVDPLESVRKQAYREAATAKNEERGSRAEAIQARSIATSEREAASNAKTEASRARAEAAATNKEAMAMIEKSRSLRERMHDIKGGDNPEPEVRNGPALK